MFWTLTAEIMIWYILWASIHLGMILFSLRRYGRNDIGFWASISVTLLGSTALSFSGTKIYEIAILHLYLFTAATYALMILLWRMRRDNG